MELINLAFSLEHPQRVGIVEIEFTGSQLNPNFCHPKPQGVVTILNIWTISPVGIGICGKSFKNILFLEKIFFDNWHFIPFGCPRQSNFTPFRRPWQPNFTPVWCPWKLNFTPFGCPDNCYSGPGMAGRIYSLTRCQGHQNGVKFGCWGHQNGVKFSCWGDWNGVKFGCRDTQME